MLLRSEYLCTSGDEDEAKKYNFCMYFATGMKTYADYDEDICAVLVKSLPPQESSLYNEFIEKFYLSEP